MSTPAFVRLQPDSTGKKIGTFEATVGSDTVELQAVVLVDSSGAEITAATAANQATQITAEQAILAKIIAAPATEAKQDSEITIIGAVNEAAPATDIASSGLNGRLQRIAQRITSFIALLPASLGGKTASLSFAVTTATDDPPLALLGAVNETAPATDTASSGLNGRLQRIAQRITSFIALFPASIGQKAKAASLAVALPTDQVGAAGSPSSDVLSVQGITSMTPLKVDGSGTALSPSANVLTVQRPSVTPVVSTAFEASHILKASAGQLVQLSVFNSNASAQFILLINATSLPSNGAVTLLYPPIPIAGATLLVLDLPAPLVASTGIVVCNSSTGSFTKTIGAADCVFYAQVN